MCVAEPFLGVLGETATNQGPSGLFHIQPGTMTSQGMSKPVQGHHRLPPAERAL